ncbi:MAG TPA: alkaline phosphatase family protein [Candidatus Krumholzibacteria bacterium]|nr:alkaline phosphatase family protein [Candidatus Krumholzibacteria bacterium]
MSKRIVLAAALAALVTGGAFAAPKVLVIGMDGLDPVMLQEFRDQGLLPNFDRFIAGGAQFQPLGTTIPPQSPVAWSTFTTGMDPGGHGIFDFIHRDPATMLPYLSTSSAQAPGSWWEVGRWKIPRGGGAVENLREGEAFWQLLDRSGVDCTVFKVPANFPPVECEARTLSGMGTPDIQGTYGIFSYITDDPAVSRAIDGGQVIPVRAVNGRIETALPGPRNTYRQGDPQAQVPLEIVVDKPNRTALLRIDGDELLLAQNEWSDWVDLDFPMVPVVKSVAGICRFYLLEVEPNLRLYVTPVQIHPEHPEMPISTPPGYSAEIARDVGLFYTQGLPEDSKALEEGVLSDRQYVSQADLVLQERMAQFRYELDHFGRQDAGFLFFYFNAPDQSCHVLWRSFDEQSPNHAEADPAVRGRVRDLYVALDGALGEALDQVGKDTVVMVCSDHGFAPFHRAMHVNAWLRERGWLALKPGVAPGTTEMLAGIDWSRTRAYAIGINGLYLNLRGRERDGIVAPGAEADSLLATLVRELEATVDEAGGGRAVRHAYRADQVYGGAWRDRGPDIIVGYERGWRGSNESALGEVPAEVFADNLMKWSGDHCMAADVVPGVVIASRPFLVPDPTLEDLAPTILGLFGVPAPPAMTGRDLYRTEGVR